MLSLSWYTIHTKGTLKSVRSRIIVNYGEIAFVDKKC